MQACTISSSIFSHPLNPTQRMDVPFCTFLQQLETPDTNPQTLKASFLKLRELEPGSHKLAQFVQTLLDQPESHAAKLLDAALRSPLARLPFHPEGEASKTSTDYSPVHLANASALLKLLVEDYMGELQSRRDVLDKNLNQGKALLSEI